MKAYQVYILGADNRITSRKDISCEDDEAAKKRVEQLADSHAIELWQEARKIASYSPQQ